MAATPTTLAAGSEAVLDLLPTPLLLIEPGSARVVFANRAAHRLAGGAFPMGREAAEYHTVYRCWDEAGHRIPNELMPGVRAARGETFTGMRMDWETPGGVRALVVAGDTVVGPAGPIALVTFEDVTPLQTAEAEARAAHEELRTILEGVADSVTVQGPDGRLVYANAAAVEMLGYPSAEVLLAADPRELLGRFEMRGEDGLPLDPETLPGRRALLGERPEPILIRFRRLPDGEPRWSRVKASPVKGPDGRVRLAINVIEDVTDIVEAERNQRYLAEAGRILAGSLDYERTLQAVAQMAVPEIADWCGVDLLVEGEIVHVAVAHVDPDKLTLAEEMRRDYPSNPDAPTGVPAVMRTGTAELYPVVDDAALAAAARDERHLELIRKIGIVSVMIAPMRLRGSVLGAVTFVSAESGRHFDERDLALAEELASRAATAVDNARMYRQRSAIAQTLQASLLPPHLPEIPGIDLAALYRAAGEGYEVGGDFYDVFDTDPDHWFVVVGDVCGKGAEAAAVTALARYTIRAAAVRRRSPAAILRWLSEAMLRHSASRFVTIACVHLDLSRGHPRLTVACGGHPLPLVLRRDGSVEEVGAAGMLLGLVDHPDVQDRGADLHPDDTLVLYTDGLTEAGAPARVWSPEDLAAALSGARGRHAQGAVEHLMATAVPDPRHPLRDDVAILALRAVPAP